MKKTLLNSSLVFWASAAAVGIICGLIAGLFLGCAPAAQFDEPTRLRVDSDRTAWELVIGADTIRSGGYCFYYEELAPEVDKVTLLTAGPRGYARLELWPLVEPAFAFGTDTLTLTRDARGDWRLE